MNFESQLADGRQLCRRRAILWGRGGFEFEAELLLKAVKSGAIGASAGATGTSPPNCVFVGSPLQVEVESAGEVGLVDYGAVEHGALHEDGEVAHGDVARGEHDALGVDGAMSWGCSLARRCGLEFGPPFDDFKLIDGEVFCSRWKASMKRSARRVRSMDICSS